MDKEDYKIAYESVMIANKMLNKEREKLNNIIEKAIKELEDNDCDEVSYYISIPYIIDILKGNDEKEKNEDKKIEKLNIKEEIDCGNLKGKIYEGNYNYDISTSEEIIADKINEIIDYINKEDDKQLKLKGWK